MEQRLTLSAILETTLKREIKKWIKNNPEDSLLNVAQQVNYASVILRTLGSQFEEEYKKPFKKIFNELH